MEEVSRAFADRRIGEEKRYSMSRRKLAFRAAVLTACALALVVVAACAGCSSASDGASSSASSVASSAASSAASSSDAAEVEQAADSLRIASMKGPTSVGLASMMQQNQGVFTVAAAADEVSALLLQDEVDIACVPANLAATLYNKTDGAVRVIDVNTLGVLYVVTADESVDSLEALAGRTVYMTGKGTVPEYTLRALLAAAGMSMDDADVQFKSEAAEVAALLGADENAVGILPQPYATALTLKNSDVKMTIDLTQAWEEATGGSQGSVITGVTVARASFIEENSEVIDEFLARHAASALVAQSDPASITSTVVDLGIIESEAIAEAAIARCNVTCLAGEDMKSALSGYLDALYAQDPSSVGGALPEDDFYYLG